MLKLTRPMTDCERQIDATLRGFDPLSSIAIPADNLVSLAAARVRRMRHVL